ncbi:MAG TPA: hypothetical protein VM582_02435, partial [Candidatus Thermoplasmatota archaeon]|nr:hypothetical protein [Candidatus Thermoplasmatota archaeon]
MWALLSELASESGVTIFLSSHDVPEIQALCRDLSVMAAGKITYSGPTAALGEDAATFENNLVRLLNGDAAPAASATTASPALRAIRRL